MRYLLFLVLNVSFILYGQKKELVPPPISLNSLFINTTLSNGLLYYRYNYKNKTIKDKKYAIYFAKRINSSIDNDIPSFKSDFSFGRQTGLVSIGFFNGNLKTGLWETLYVNKLVKTAHWDNGLITGLYTVKTTKGVLLYNTNFGPKGNGKFKDYYYKSGVLKQEGDYQNGKKEGEWCNYNTQGELTTTVHYKQGVVVK